MYNGILPVTGAAGFMLFGHSVGMDTFILVAVGLIGTGVVLYRFGSRAVRRNRAAS